MMMESSNMHWSRPSLRAWGIRSAAIAGKLRRFLVPSGITLLLACLVCLFFWRVLFFRESFHIPYDLADYHYGLTHEVFVGLKRGYFALWDPYNYSGIPLVGNINAQMFYPPTLLFLKLSDWIHGSFPYHLMEWLQIAHYIVAGVCAYLLARSFSLSRVAAILVAVVYQFGEFFASQTQHLGAINGAAWTPLVFYFLKRAHDARRLVYASWAGVCLALTILAGFPAMITSAVVVISTACLFVFAAKLKAHTWSEAKFVLIALAITIGCGVGLTAIQLLPSAELSNHSVAAEHHSEVGLGGMPAEAYMSFFVPNILGSTNPAYWGGVNFTFAYFYLGIAPVFLMVVGLLCPRKSETFLVLSVTLFSLFWVLGEVLPLSSWIWLALPPSIRGGIYTFCTRASFDLGVALLAGFGLEQLKNGINDTSSRGRIKLLLKFVALLVLAMIVLNLMLLSNAAATEYGKPERERLVIITQGITMAVILLLLTAGLIYWRVAGYVRGSTSAWLLVLITIIDLFGSGSGKRFNTSFGSRKLLNTPDTIEGQGYPLDVIKTDPDYQRGNFSRMESNTFGRGWLTTSRLWQIENANGDDPFLLKDYVRFRALIGEAVGTRQFVLKKPESKLLDLLSVKLVVTQSNGDHLQDQPSLRRVGDHFYRVYLNPDFLPRAFLVTRVTVEENLDAVFRHMASPEYEPRRYLVIEETTARRLGNLDSFNNSTTQESEGTARILSHTPNTITISVASAAEAFLVLSEIYYPGWRAYVDGHEEDLVRANGILRAVRLKAGNHQVEFRYQPYSLYAGATMSGITLLLILSTSVFSFRASKRDETIKANLN
jgi:Bacterial membrane protein YfhO